jgi:N-methylhydantoinase A
MLRVGPESAGSDPGPVCYGRGGERPTITDANVILGRLDPATFGAGADRLAAARAAVDIRIARPLGFTVEEAASAIVRLANTHMAGAIRMVSLSRGFDPRDFVLFAFGGAGPLHAVEIARELGIPEVLVPARPGLTNALGCLVADLRQDFVRTVNTPVPEVDPDMIEEILDGHASAGRAINAEEQDEIVETAVIHAADMQFRGQTHLIRVPLSSSRMTRDDLQARFEEAYFARFQVRLPEVRAVLVNLTSSVIGRRPQLSLAALSPPTATSVPPPARADWTAAAVHDRASIPAGAAIEGPAVIRQMDATTWVAGGSSARVDAGGNLRIAVGTAP